MARWRRAPLRSERAFSTLGQPQAGRMGDDCQHVPGRRRDGPASRRCPGNCDHVSPVLTVRSPNRTPANQRLTSARCCSKPNRVVACRNGTAGAALRAPRHGCRRASGARHSARHVTFPGEMLAAVEPLRDARGLHPIGTAGPGDAASGCDACTPHGTRPFFAGHGVLPPKLAAGPAIRVDRLDS